MEQYCSPEEVVLPGQIVKDDDLEKASNEFKIVLGPGLKRSGDSVIVSKAGILRKKNLMLWVDGNQRRYIPARNENVVGIVIKKIGDIYKVDIGSSEQASISYLAFENSNKKNRPNINAGDILFAKLVTACPDMEPELTCIDSLGKSGIMGVLDGTGLLFTCSLHLIRKILNPKCKLLKILGKRFSYDCSIGENGRIWVKGKNTDTTHAVANAILSAENRDLTEIHEFCEQLLISMKRTKR